MNTIRIKNLKELEIGDEFYFNHCVKSNRYKVVKKTFGVLHFQKTENSYVYSFYFSRSGEILTNDKIFKITKHND